METFIWDGVFPETNPSVEDGFTRNSPSHLPLPRISWSQVSMDGRRVSGRQSFRTIPCSRPPLLPSLPPKGGQPLTQRVSWNATSFPGGLASGSVSGHGSTRSRHNEGTYSGISSKLPTLLKMNASVGGGSSHHIAADRAAARGGKRLQRISMESSSAFDPGLLLMCQVWNLVQN